MNWWNVFWFANTFGDLQINATVEGSVSVKWSRTLPLAIPSFHTICRKLLKESAKCLRAGEYILYILRQNYHRRLGCGWKVEDVLFDHGGILVKVVMLEVWNVSASPSPSSPREPLQSLTHMSQTSLVIKYEKPIAYLHCCWKFRWEWKIDDAPSGQPFLPHELTRTLAWNGATSHNWGINEEHSALTLLLKTRLRLEDQQHSISPSISSAWVATNSY